MGKSSPTKLQLKHVPDPIVLATIYLIQNLPTVWIGKAGGINDMSFEIPKNMSSISYRTKRTATRYEIQEALKPLPEKLVWAKLQKLERLGKISSHGPASIRFRVED